MQNLKGIYHNILLIVILLAGFFCRIYASLIDPFLHDWDEKYHAVVSRNLMKFPLKPMLNKVMLIDYDINSWAFNHIWLHKQPLFMWQIAAFMKLFGVSTFTLRMPSVIMGTLMILLIYRIAMLTTQNKVVSIVSALFMCFSLYQLNLISGRKGMDHNDVAFGFYILCSFWAYFEHLHQPKLFKWVILTGLFAGCAVLNKWLTGILVFAPWGIITLYHFYKTRKITEFKNISISFVVCLLIFLPWQLYIFYRFPVEAAYEHQFAANHLFYAMENHAGDMFFYIGNFDMYFGRNIFVFLAIGFIVALFYRHWKSKFHFSLIFSFFLVLFFFSCIAQTKVQSLIFIIVPVGFLYASVGIEFIFSRIKIPGIVIIAIAAALILYVSNPQMLAKETHLDTTVPARIYNDSIYRNIKRIIPADIKIVIHAYATGPYDIMFYHDDISATATYIEEKHLAICARHKIKIACFADNPYHATPSFVKEYPYIFIIPVILK